MSINLFNEANVSTKKKGKKDVQKKMSHGMCLIIIGGYKAGDGSKPSLYNVKECLENSYHNHI